MDSKNNQHVPDNATSATSIVGNSVALGSSVLLARAIAFFGTMYLARTLGPEGFGTIGFALATVGYFGVSISAGLNEAGSLEVARHPHRASSIAASMTVVRFGLALVALGALALLTYFLAKPFTVKIVLLATGLSLLTLALDTSWVYKGLAKNSIAGAALVLGQALYVGGALVTVQGPADVAWVPLVQCLGELGAALLLGVLLLRIGPLHVDLSQGFNILNNSWFLLTSKVGRIVLFTFDILLLGFLFGEQAVGLYSAPYRICLLLLALAAVIQMAYLPAFAHAATQSSGSLSNVSERSWEVVSAVTFPVMVGGWILAEPIVGQLFGAEYLGGVDAFKFLLLSLGCILFYGGAHNLLLVQQQTHIETRIMVAGAVLNVLLNIALIPYFELTGAALSRVAAEGFILAMGLFAVAKMGIRMPARSVIRPFGAAVAMGICLVFVGRHIHWVGSVGLGFIVYAAFLTLLRGVPQDVSSYLMKMPFLSPRRVG